jgi:hypothetical protein
MIWYELTVDKLIQCPIVFNVKCHLPTNKERDSLLLMEWDGHVGTDLSNDRRVRDCRVTEEVRRDIYRINISFPWSFEFKILSVNYYLINRVRLCTDVMKSVSSGMPVEFWIIVGKMFAQFYERNLAFRSSDLCSKYWLLSHWRQILGIYDFIWPCC